MEKTDYLIAAKWMITCEDNNRVLENHVLAIKNGNILAILPRKEAEKTYQAPLIEYASHAIMPGLVNAHTHLAMNLFRGLADDLPLMTWLQDHIWPAEGKWVADDFVHDGSLAAMAEMIRGGVTTFADMYFFPNATARAAQ